MGGGGEGGGEPFMCDIWGGVFCMVFLMSFLDNFSPM